MNYDKILSVAGANKQATSSAQIKRYSTEISAPKKPQKNGVQSEAVKAFLARKQKEEEMKARQAEHRKNELLELRSMARNGRKANAMAKRTKDNNFMRNFAKTAELADTSREQNGRSGPQWCSVRPKNRDTNDIVNKNQDCESPEARRTAPKRPQSQAPPPPNFYDLLKVAAKKQHEPLALPRIPKKKDVALEEQGRMMTVEEKRRFIEEQARKQGKSLTEVVIPKKTRKRYVPGQEVDSYELAVKPQQQSSDANRSPTGLKTQRPQPQSQQPRLKPSSAQATSSKMVQSSSRDQKTAKRTDTNVCKPLSDDRRSVNGQRLLMNPLYSPPPQERRKYYPDEMPKKQKIENDIYEEQLKAVRNRSSSSSSKTVSSQLKKQPISQERTVESKTKISSTRGNVSTNSKMSNSPSTSQSGLRKPVAAKSPYIYPALPNVSSPPSRLRDSSQQVKPRPQMQSKGSPSKSLTSRDQQNRQLSSRDSQNRQLPPRETQNRQLPSRETQNRQLPSRDSQNRQLPSRDSQNRQLPSRDSQNRQLPSRDSQNRQLPSRETQNRQLQSREPQNRPIRAREPEIRQFPPRDLMPKQFPPRDVVRRPMQQQQRPAMKRRIESDDEDEYDEEMDDFIDDGPIDGENMNYSEHIKEIFGYDRSKYRYMDDDDMCMESSYLQQMKEEAISAKLGILEDLEDIQREEQEMRRKMIRNKKK